jgi:hypothetical protein
MKNNALDFGGGKVAHVTGSDCGKGLAPVSVGILRTGQAEQLPRLPDKPQSVDGSYDRDCDQEVWPRVEHTSPVHKCQHGQASGFHPQDLLVKA